MRQIHSSWAVALCALVLSGCAPEFFFGDGDESGDVLDAVTTAGTADGSSADTPAGSDDATGTADTTGDGFPDEFSGSVTGSDTYRLFELGAMLSALTVFPAVLLGAWLGNRIHVRISEEAFRRVVSGALVAIGILLLFR